MKAVCFDVGGVLARINYTWERAMQTAGLPFSEAASRGIQEYELFDAYQAGRVREEEYLRGLSTYLDVATEQARSAHNAILLQEMPGVLELVLELNARGVITGILSNTNAPHFEEMLHSGRFPAIASTKVKLASHSMRLDKPNAEAYRAWEREAGVSGADILFFDDSPANIEGAKQCGWGARLIDPHGDTALQMRQALRAAT